MQQTNHPYHPMHEGVIHEYEVYEITGTVAHSQTGETITTIPSDLYTYRVGVDSRTLHGNSPQHITFIHDLSNTVFGNVPYFGSYYTYPTQREYMDKDSLMTGFGVTWDGQQQMPYLGEARNELGNFTVPPIPILPMFPRVGQTMDINLSVYDSSGILLDPAWRVSLYVLSHETQWAQWKDCWVTVLTERASSHVYEYVFARGIGLVDFWFGGLENGRLIGFEYYLKKVIKGTRL